MTDDMAIEDTIYVLGKALDKERITLDVFLKVITPPRTSLRRIPADGDAAHASSGARAVYEASAGEEDIAADRDDVMLSVTFWIYAHVYRGVRSTA